MESCSVPGPHLIGQRGVLCRTQRALLLSEHRGATFTSDRVPRQLTPHFAPQVMSLATNGIGVASTPVSTGINV